MGLSTVLENSVTFHDELQGLALREVFEHMCEVEILDATDGKGERLRGAVDDDVTGPLVGGVPGIYGDDAETVEDVGDARLLRQAALFESSISIHSGDVWGTVDIHLHTIWREPPGLTVRDRRSMTGSASTLGRQATLKWNTEPLYDSQSWS
jgi:hypothetical protein